MKIQIRTKKKPWRSVEIMTRCDESYDMTHITWLILDESLDFWNLESADSGGSEKVID